jgi:hypothetical protein
MIFYNNDLDDDSIADIIREKKEEQDQYIQKQYDKGVIPDYRNIQNCNGKSKKNGNPITITSEIDIEKNKILNEIQKLRQESPELIFEQWSNTLNEKRQKLNDKVNEYFPEILLELDFILSIKTILNIEDITLPFMGIVFAVPSSMKTKVIEILRKWPYSYFTDKFTPKSFVSHSATVPKDKLKDVDLLPRIKDKILLTPELSPLFTGKDEDIKEQFGIITRLLDGNGLETESGVHGKRGYYGNYMFTWIGAAVDIPPSVYKFLSTIGFKIDSHRGYFRHSKYNTKAEVASNNIQSDSAESGGTTLSSSVTTAFPAITSPLQQQSMESKIQAGLFTNSLISVSDLLTGNYDPEIINNIDRVHPNSDRWFCYNCTLRDDKWGMMKHLCKHNKKRKKETEA